MDEQRANVARHEAGHVLATSDAGAHVLAASCRVLPPLNGWTQLVEPEDPWARGGIAVAGELGERILKGWRPSGEPAEEEPWFTDLELKAGARIWSDLADDAAALAALGLTDRIVHEIRRRTAALLRRRRDELEALAGALYVAGVLSGPDLAAAIERGRKEPRWMLT
jgi:hypothetical protein